MIKKLTGIILVLILFLSMLSFTTLGAATEHLTNGDFEILDANGKPQGWGLVGGTISNGFCADSSGAYSGVLGLGFKPQGTALYSSQTMTTLVAGQRYIFSGWLKAVDLSGSNAVIKIEFYNGINTVDSISKTYSINDANNVWSRVHFVFTMPASAVSATILVRNTSTSGEIYWDTLSVRNLEELLVNGNFEATNSNGTALTDWSALNGWGSTQDGFNISVASDVVHGGSKSLKITGTTGNPYIKQAIQNPVVGATYEASFWYNITSATALPGFKIEWYKYIETELIYINGVWVKDAPVKTATNGWMQYTYQFTVPEDCSFLNYYVRLYTDNKQATVYFDDVSCYIIEDAPIRAVTLSTDEAFYYTGTGKGVATVKANFDDFPSVETMEIKLKDGETVLDGSTLLPDANGLALWRFNISLLVQEQKEYTVEVSAKNALGNVLGTAIETIMRYPRPTLLSEDGTVLINSQPFYPVFAYHLYKADLPYAAQVGINTVQAMPGGSTLELLGEYLDEAQNYGVKCLVPLYRNMKPAGHPDNVAYSTEIINTYKNHPAVLAWMVMDEATSYWPDRWDLFFDSYNLIRGLDIVHPVYILQNNKEQFAKLSKYTDILAYDPYPPVSANLTTWVANYTTTAVNGVCYKKPVWCLNKAYSATAQYDPSYPNSRLLPTIMEERNLWYQALFAGASAVGYYSFSDAIVTPRTAMYNTPLWNGLVEFADEEMEESYNFFLKHQYPVFSDGRNQDVWWSSYIKDGSIYMVVLNRSESQTSVSIPVKSDGCTIEIDGFTAEMVYGGTGTTTGSKSLNTTLESSAAYVYRITPNVAVDFSPLSATKFHDLYNSTWAAEQIRELESQNVITGITKSAYMPNTKVTKGDFVQYLSNALNINISVQNPYDEISRQDMIGLCKNGLLQKGSTISDYILSEAMAKVRQEILLGNINLNDNVTRAEAAYVLERIIKWQNTQSIANETLYKSISKVGTENIDVLYNGLVTVESNEVYDNKLYYKTWIENNKQYILIQNADEIQKSIDINAIGTCAKALCGGVGSIYQNNILTANIPSGEILLFEIMDSTEYGIYDGNIMLSHLESGNFKIKYFNISTYNDLVMVGLYIENNSNLELVSFLDTVKELDGWSITVPSLDESKNYMVKSLMWDSFKGMHPYNQAYILQ